MGSNPIRVAINPSEDIPQTALPALEVRRIMGRTTTATGAGMPNFDDYKKALSYDALSEAARLTGRPEWTTEAIDRAGELGAEHRIKIAALLEEMADTTYSMRFDDYLRIARSAGFDRLLEEQLGAEHVVVLGRSSDTILLVVDSYRGNLNSASVQFRWAGEVFPEEGLVETNKVSYGKGSAWICSFDAREGLLARLVAMEQGDGAFLTHWWNLPPGIAPAGEPRLWLEQDETVARKQGIHPTDMPRHLDSLSRSRASRLPPEWKARLDVDRIRSQAEAIGSA